MDSQRFDAAVKALATTGSRRQVFGGVLAAIVAGLRPSWAAAQEEVAAAGNGGTAESSANGGAVATSNINSGANSGHAIGVGDTAGGVEIDGGAAANATNLNVAADGGTAISDASGGDDNVAFIDETCSNVSACPAPERRNDCGTPDSNCGCWPTTENISFCGQSDFCILLPPCATSADCPGGQACVATCCDELKCTPPCSDVQSTSLQSSGIGGPTALGR